jgi:surfeit locus 1 family protein
MSRAARIGYGLAALLATGSFATLGTWQVGRGLAKEDRLQREALALARESAAELTHEATRSDETSAVTRVEGRGHYEAPLLLLDNQQRRGKVGVRVYAIALPDGDKGERRVLVDLGWVAMPPDRRLPSLELPRGERHLNGLLLPWPGQGLRLAPTPWPDSRGEPVLLNTLDRDDIQTALGLRLAPRVLRLAPEADHGYERDLDALPNTLPPQRHYGYAVQWYALALTVVVTCFVLRRRARRPAPRDSA